MESIKKLIKKYQKEIDKYGMSSVINYWQVVKDLESLESEDECKHKYVSLLRCFNIENNEIHNL